MRKKPAKEATPSSDEALPVDPVVEAYKKDIDRTLLRRSLKLTPEQRLDELMELQCFAEELRNAPRTESIAELEALLEEGHNSNQ